MAAKLYTLASFDGTNGANPFSVIADAAGDLFGTTKDSGVNGDGTVFEIANSGYVVYPSTFHAGFF